MKETTLCYLEQDGRLLMLHRIKKEKDVNKDNIPKKTIIVSYAVINITSLLCILANQFQSREATTLS